MAAKKNPLGRNLSSMLSKSALQHAAENVVSGLSGQTALRELPLDLVTPGPYQPRSIFDANRLEELADQVAKRAKSSGEPQSLFNLTPAQRRIVHMTLAEDLEIKTESVGEGKERYLLVSPEK